MKEEGTDIGNLVSELVLSDALEEKNKITRKGGEQ
jgi:hypothetical protein